MTMFHFQTHVSESGVISLPPQAEELYGKVVVVNVAQPFGDDLQQEERRQKIAAEKARIADQTPEEWQAAVETFMASWKGCLKGVPHMTAKEIRAERLEKKYGQRGDKE